jgi:hypothetical protein
MSHGFAIAVCFVALSLVAAAMAPDPLQVAPEHYKVLFENDRVRVLAFHSKPGDKWALHSHPDAVTVSLSNYKLRNVVPGSDATVMERKLGEAYWIPARSHTGENIGHTDMESIIVELK